MDIGDDSGGGGLSTSIILNCYNIILSCSNIVVPYEIFVLHSVFCWLVSCMPWILTRYILWVLLHNINWSGCCFFLFRSCASQRWTSNVLTFLYLFLGVCNCCYNGLCSLP